MPRTKVNNAGITVRIPVARVAPAPAVGVPLNPVRAAPDSARNATVLSPVRVHHTTIVTVQTHPAQVKVEPSPKKRPFPSDSSELRGPVAGANTHKTPPSKDYSVVPPGGPVKPLDENLFPCEQKAPGKMRLDGQSNIWILQASLMDIEGRKLAGKEWLREVVNELLSLDSARSKELLKVRSANGKGVTALVSPGFLKAIKEYVRTEHEQGNNPKFDDLKNENVAELLQGYLKTYY